MLFVVVPFPFVVPFAVVLLVLFDVPFEVPFAVPFVVVPFAVALLVAFDEFVVVFAVVLLDGDAGLEVIGSTADDNGGSSVGVTFDFGRYGFKLAASSVAVPFISALLVEVVAVDAALSVAFRV